MNGIFDNASNKKYNDVKPNYSEEDGVDVLKCNTDCKKCKYRDKDSTINYIYTTGTYYIYDTNTENGKIPVVENKDYVGAVPASKYINGWIEYSDKIASLNIGDTVELNNSLLYLSHGNDRCIFETCIYKIFPYSIEFHSTWNTTCKLCNQPMVIDFINENNNTISNPLLVDRICDECIDKLKNLLGIVDIKPKE